MRNWLKTLLFLSAFSPVLLSLAYVRYQVDGAHPEVAALILFGISGVAVTILIVKSIMRAGESIAFSAKKIESNDVMLLAFVGSYFLPIIARASELNMEKTIIITVIIASLLWFMSSIPPHPLLRILSFRFYKVESSSGVVYTLISRREIRDPRDIKFVKKISGSMLMEVT